MMPSISAARLLFRPNRGDRSLRSRSEGFGTLSTTRREHRIAEKLKLPTNHQSAPDVKALLANVRAGKADVGGAAISITPRDEEGFDFFQSILDAGLQIMVRRKGRKAGWNPLGALLCLRFLPRS
jgi:hypothetical protein